MLKEIIYTINPKKREEFMKSFYSTALDKEDWGRIKNESQVLDKVRLESLFKEQK